MAKQRLRQLVTFVNIEEERGSSKTEKMACEEILTILH